MLKIKELIEKMDDTLEEAEFYAVHSKIEKELFPQISEVYYKLSVEHLNHYMLLHSAVVSVINEYKKTKEEVPHTMNIIWNYEHEKLIEHYNEIKKMLEMNKS